MGVSDLIAGFIQEMLEAEKGFTELQRAELASRFNCVPSQINYVIATRFSPEHGYIVESRRGGGGYIRIRRAEADPGRLIMHTVNMVGGAIDSGSVQALVENLTNAGAIEKTCARLILAATGHHALRPVPPQSRDAARAEILKQMLIHLTII